MIYEKYSTRDSAKLKWICNKNCHIWKCRKKISIFANTTQTHSFRNEIEKNKCESNKRNTQTHTHKEKEKIILKYFLNKITHSIYFNK